jgi:tetratricopeptide (TPR) repeat protein
VSEGETADAGANGGDGTAAPFAEGKAALAAGDAAAAEAAFARVLSFNPQHIAALRGQAEALERLGRAEEAAGQRGLADALEADALASSGTDLLRAGKPEVAERAFRRALEVDPTAGRALKGLADVARRRGELEAARAHYAAMLQANPHDIRARAGNAAFAGPALADPPGGVPVPVPFLRTCGFLPAHLRDAAFAYGMEHLGEMQDATVVDRGGHQVQIESRRSRLLYEPAEIVAWFLPLIESALPEVCPAVGVAPFDPTRIELQMTLHTGGHFYRAHRDVGGPDEAKSEIDARRISFVYYMSRTPRPFSGGELRLYDSDFGVGRFWDEHAWTLIEPEDNSIVFFPSPAMHEVMPVELDSGDPADGRLTLNGWVHGTTA